MKLFKNPSKEELKEKRVNELFFLLLQENAQLFTKESVIFNELDLYEITSSLVLKLKTHIQNEYSQTVENINLEQHHLYFIEEVLQKFD